MNEKILTTLAFDQVKDQMKRYLVTAAGKKELQMLEPLTEFEQVNQLLTETTDGANILRLVGLIPVPQLDDISTQLKRLKIDATLSATELAAIGRVLRASGSVKLFFDKLRQQSVPLQTIMKYIDEIVTIPTVTKRLVISIENDGHITDEASSKLHGIRQKITQTEAQIRQKMEAYTRGKNAKYLSDTIITMRNDRYVIPVQANYRSHFGGVVHDQSQTGQTLFIEPQDVMELNNRLRQAQIEERQEEIHVLEDLSTLITPYRADIGHNETILGKLDFINAKAQFAHDNHDTLPILNEDNHVDLRQARHPLLDIKKAVANDISIGSDYQAIVITGPNTGGKTITLKTLGLIQLMGQAGLYIPANEESTIGIFSDVFADIGDEQSLEQSLSTFSAHMDNTISILHQIDARSLVLLDEVGAGTDPKEGAALAMAILDAIGAKGSLVVATTHYPELKVYGYNRPQTTNASMEFDATTLKPTYRLLMGIPGRSNALEIASRLGLDEGIIAEAKSLTSEDSQDLNDMIGDLVAQRKLAHDQTIKLEQDLTAAQKLHDELTTKLKQYEEQKDKLMQQARQEANHTVSAARQKADKIVDQLRMLQRQGVEVKENQLIDAKGQLNALHVEDPRLKHNKVLQREKRKHDFAVGDAVLVKSYGQYGELVQKRGQSDWEVQLGILKMQVNERDLEKVSQDQKLAQERTETKKRPLIRTTQTRQATARLDLRGHRYEQAMQELDQFIDHAILNNLTPVTIIHGKGTGALRKGTHEYLQSNSRVASFEYAAPNAGGDGATIAYLQ
ncbi:endonuclease MutS2 [Paucilactobacillus kaifaensis]|uniref:endonuclease MutS2 n=1 Tax=Paucilactobacillus kaifaensis TaxID=2559921 RepID=UPI0010F7CAE8|nr:endonuclease MutS2 [Paucilactobacillus kaifaensis]